MINNKTILYLHGFNSDGIGYKPDALRAHFKNDIILAPDLEADPVLVQQAVRALIGENPGDLFFIGTSLGGFYAWYFGALTGRPAFLYNPSMQPHVTLDDRGVGHFKTWTKARDYHFKTEYLAVLESMREEAKERESPENLNFFLATDDDVIDHLMLPAEYPDANFLQWFDQVGHRFSTFADTMPLVEELMRG
ncbi:MAG: hypothetical protein KDC85_08555 [Saprospiraceae bacterium]|nr:hypothetical protein [Saprospiraceae bacterium]MCB9326576.1 hypothetical protein [Lewinellaceae bacterium]